MKKQDVKKEIQQALLTEFATFGFEKYYGQLGVLRKTKHGFDCISIGLYEYIGQYQYSPSFGVRVNEVEEIFNQFSDIDLTDQKMTRSALMSMDKITSEYNIDILKEGDALIGLVKIKPVIIDKAFKFFNECNTVAKLDNYLNNKINKSGKFYGFDTYQRGLIAAKLNNNPDVKQLIISYSEIANNWHPNENARLTSIIKFIKNE